MTDAWRTPSPSGRDLGRLATSVSLRQVRKAVSYRRLLLDAHLASVSGVMTGTVIDLGGKRQRRRGEFQPPEDEPSRWIVVNIDPGTEPDLLCDVTAVPVPGDSADCVLCTEVLEHLPDPKACVQEAIRLLRPGGTFIASVPFMYPVHPDPHDFQRFTPDGLHLLLKPFSSVEIRAMGGIPGTVGSLIELGGRQASRAHLHGRWLRRGLFELGRLLAYLDLRRGNAARDAQATTLTTGYFAVAVK